MDRELRQLHDGAEQLRLTTVGSLLTVLERTARDAAQALSKRVIFEASGGDVRLDSHVIETIQRALVQLIRNAVAHGIEQEVERKAATSRLRDGWPSMFLGADGASCSSAGMMAAVWISRP
jgi:two-component system chemotaxis sensor kinase CheA